MKNQDVKIKQKKIKYRKKKKAIVGKEAAEFGRAALSTPVMESSHNQSFGSESLENSSKEESENINSNEPKSIARDEFIEIETGGIPIEDYLRIMPNNKPSNPSMVLMKSEISIPFWKRMLSALGISRNK